MESWWYWHGGGGFWQAERYGTLQYLIAFPSNCSPVICLSVFILTLHHRLDSLVSPYHLHSFHSFQEKENMVFIWWLILMFFALVKQTLKMDIFAVNKNKRCWITGYFYLKTCISSTFASRRLIKFDIDAKLGNEVSVSCAGRREEME